jgi:hypothetical protein
MYPFCRRKVPITMKITKEQVDEAVKMAYNQTFGADNEGYIAAGILIANAILEIDDTLAAVAQKIVNYLH